MQKVVLPNGNEERESRAVPITNCNVGEGPRVANRQKLPLIAAHALKDWKAIILFPFGAFLSAFLC